MGYTNALKLAGAEIHAFKRFGTYQGDWYAKVTYNGITGFIQGSFGSCSMCDAFEHEFESVMHTHENGDNIFGGLYEDEIFDTNCNECQETQKRLKSFGERYLDNILTKEEAIAKASENIAWDLDAQDLVNWLKEN